MQRYMLFIVVAVATVVALAAAPEARAQATAGGTLRIRCPGCASTARDSTRVRREQLLLKFDSLRYEFDHQRSEVERDRLAGEMRKTVMSIQESFDDGGLRASAFAAERAGTEMLHEKMPMPPEGAAQSEVSPRPAAVPAALL